MGETIYGIQSVGIIKQGDVHFIISKDAFGIEELTAVDWGNIDVTKKYTKTFFIINTGTNSLTLTNSIQNWNWVTTNPANEILLTMVFEPTPLAPGRFRAGVFEMTIIKPLPSGDPANPVSKFKYDIIITGTPVA
jgi:hypothetical protein